MGGGCSIFLCVWFGILQMKIPKLVGDKGQVTISDLVIQLHPIGVVNLGDEAYLKHNKSTCKRHLPGAPTVRIFSSGNTDHCIYVQRIRWVAHMTLLTPVEAHRDKIRKRTGIDVVFTRSIIKYRIHGKTCVLSIYGLSRDSNQDLKYE
jgi:hypothetical protein